MIGPEERFFVAFVLRADHTLPVDECQQGHVRNHHRGVLQEIQHLYGVGVVADGEWRLEMLHEAGHVLGLDHSPDPASVMYEQYLGLRAGLSAGDVADLQAAYGVRQADGYEGAGGNGTLATATPLNGSPVQSGNVLAATADITTTADVDCYSFVVPTGVSAAKVRLYTSGVSLLVSQLEQLRAVVDDQHQLCRACRPIPAAKRSHDHPHPRRDGERPALGLLSTMSRSSLADLRRWGHGR